MEVYTQSNKLQVYVKLNPGEVQLEDGFTRDVRNIGHFGTGDLEIAIRNEEDFTKAEPLILRSYLKSRNGNVAFKTLFKLSIWFINLNLKLEVQVHSTL